MIYLVTLFNSLDEENNGRAKNIYDNLNQKATLITSDFSHSHKKYINHKHVNEKIIHVPSYKSNLSIKRLYSHIYFAFKIKKYLNSLVEKPTAIYCAMPTSSSAYICGKFCKKNNIKFIIDIIDLWPDSLISVNNKFKWIKYFLFPWKRLTICAYKLADYIVGESIEYTNIARIYNKNAPFFTAYLGVDRNKVKKLIEGSNIIIEKPNDELWIGYGGSLGNSYDFDYLIKSVSELNNRVKYKLIFIGDGVQRNEIESKLKFFGVNSLITGFLKYDDYLNYLSHCDIAINIFKKDTKVVHSYKFNDYIATGCFILNSLEGETAKMIDDYLIGKNFNFTDNQLSYVLIDVVENWNQYKGYKNNLDLIIDDILDSKMIYKKVASIIEVNNR